MIEEVNKAKEKYLNQRSLFKSQVEFLKTLKE